MFDFDVVTGPTNPTRPTKPAVTGAKPPSAPVSSAVPSAMHDERREAERSPADPPGSRQ